MSMTFSFQLFTGIRSIPSCDDKMLLTTNYIKYYLQHYKTGGRYQFLRKKRISNNIIHQNTQKVARIINISQNFFSQPRRESETSCRVLMMMTFYWPRHKTRVEQPPFNLCERGHEDANINCMSLFIDSSRNSKTNIQPPVGHACIVNWGSCF